MIMIWENNLLANDKEKNDEIWSSNKVVLYFEKRPPQIARYFPSHHTVKLNGMRGGGGGLTTLCFPRGKYMCVVWGSGIPTNGRDSYVH